MRTNTIMKVHKRRIRRLRQEQRTRAIQRYQLLSQLVKKAHKCLIEKQGQHDHTIPRAKFKVQDKFWMPCGARIPFSIENMVRAANAAIKYAEILKRRQEA